MIYIQLFLSYLKIGFFGFGGGYAMLSLIENEIVTRHGWLTAAEMADIIAVSQITPGPIAVNSATYVGYAVTGSVWGAALATVSVCLPSLTLMLLATRFYLKLRSNRYVAGAMAMMRPVMAGMILAAGMMLFTPDTFIDARSWMLFGGCFLLAMQKVSPMLLIALSAAAGIILYA